MDVNVTVGEKGYQKHFEKLPAIFPTDEGTLAFFQAVDSVTLQDGTKSSSDREGRTSYNCDNKQTDESGKRLL